MTEPAPPTSTTVNSDTVPMASQNLDISGNDVGRRKGKFHNGWTEEQEELMSKWADTGSCYRWLHDRGEKMYTTKNMNFTIPVIILTTLTGTAAVGLGQIVGPDPTSQKYGQFAIGGISLVSGILTTLGNFFKYAQLSESNRVASIAWGKFQRQIAVELSLHPNDRIDSMDFIKICRAELDRLIEQSPPISDSIIAAFEKEFKDLPNLTRPDICHGIEHTQAFKDKKSRMKQIASEVSMLLYHKKRALREQILPDLDSRIARIIEGKIDDLRGELTTQAAVTVGPDTRGAQMQRRVLAAFDPDARRMLIKPTSPKSPTTAAGTGLAANAEPLLGHQPAAVNVVEAPDLK